MSTTACSTDCPELQGEILVQGVSGRFTVINISANAIISAKLDTFYNLEISILGFTYKGLPSQLTSFFTWK